MKIGRFLVVDCAQENSGWIAEDLTQYGCLVISVPAIPEAIEVAKGGGFDAVIVVGKRAHFDTKDMEQLLKTHGANSIPDTCLRVAACLDLPAVDQIKLLRRGFSDVIPLPVYVGQLMLRLRSLSRMALMQRELQRRRNTLRDFLAASDVRDLALDFGADPLRAIPLRPRILTLRMNREAPLSNWLVDLAKFSEPIYCDSTEEAQTLLFSGQADVTVIDTSTYLRCALEFTAAMRSTATLYNHPVLLCVPQGISIDMKQTFAAGPNDLFVGEMSHEEMQARIHALLRHERLRQHLSEECDASGDTVTRDSLTGLFTYGYGMAHIGEIQKEFAITKASFVLAALQMTNIDEINAEYGYAGGDCVLREVAQAVRQCLRGEDLCVRIKGRTLLIGFPETGYEEANIAINRLLSILRFTMFRVAHRDESVAVSFSHGLKVLGPTDTLDSLLRTLLPKIAVAA
jgi:diguanylate cyclase (GGDEF)-like protein